MDKHEIVKKARANALKYWMIPMGAMLFSVIAAVLTVIFGNVFIGLLLLFLGVWLLPRILWNRLRTRYVGKPYQRGEVELFCQTVKAIGLDSFYNPEWALVLMEEGNHQELVNLCTAQIKRLAAKKRKTYRIRLYHYLFVLTRYYFRVGDNEKTAQLCAVYREWLKQEKPSFARRVEQHYSALAIYEKYLAGDAEGCLALLCSDPLKGGKMSMCGDLLIKARIKARLQGETEAALFLYAEIEAMLSDGDIWKCAHREAENLIAGRPYGFGVAELLPDEAYVLQLPKKVKRRRTLYLLFGLFLMLLWAVPLLLTMPV